MIAQISHLPVLVISAHSRCNCRCGMCEIWRATESLQFTAADLDAQLRDIGTLGVEWVVFTGGEALMNADLFEMAHTLRAAGIRVTVLTSGLLVGRYAAKIVASIDDVIVSLDGPREIHDKIRGTRGAFDQLHSGVLAVRALAPGYPIGARCTVQRANHAALLDTARAARSLGFASISFLAVDVSSEAFNRSPGALDPPANSLLLTGSDVETLHAEVARLLADPVREIIAESPEKLRRLIQYFRAFADRRDPEAPRCNAPWVSAVVNHDGVVRPCFFHPPIGNLKEQSLAKVLNSERALAFRNTLDIASNPICRRCVCSLFRPAQVESAVAV
jgi:MoaA/NifB/PqqE/SkfB family radical SAM enzyme